MYMQKYLRVFTGLVLIFCCSYSTHVTAQKITLEDIQNLDITKILGGTQLLKVDKGFNPVFYIGKNQINSVGLLGEKIKGINILGDILDSKNVNRVMGMYKTYKTGLVVYKILSSAGTVVTVIGTVKGLTDEDNFNDATVKKMLYPALASVATGVITKLLTKAASYKAVDVFNGVVRNKVKDIFSIQPASSTLGIGLYVKL